VTLIFALSAMCPATMPAAVRHCAAALAPGGALLVRDYAAGDLAETRLDAKQQKLGDSFYVRGDGTRAFYFTREALVALCEAEGLTCAAVAVHERDITNRAQGVTMERRWIQATFLKSSAHEAAPQAAAAAGAAAAALPLLADGDDGATEAEGLGSTGGDLSGLFGGGGPAEAAAAAAPRLLTSAGRALRLRLLGREHQHTERATGSMLWEGARALAEHLACNPALVAGLRVIELGAGAAALPSLAAASCGAAVALATDGHPGVLCMLAANLEANGLTAGVPCRRLRWGHAGDTAAALGGSAGAHGAPYDVVLGADVVYDAAALPALFGAARSLLRCGKGAAAGALLLCHVADRGGVSEAALERAAAGAGLLLAEEALVPAALAVLEGAPRCRLLRGTLRE
jgi:methyltransferase-like protein 6